MTKLAIFVAVGAAVVIKLDVKPGEIRLVRLAHLGDQLFFGSPLFASPNHDRRAVCVVGTDVDTAISDQFLVSDPDVGLDVFDQVADVDRSVGVRERAGDEQPPLDWFLGVHSKSLEPRGWIR